MKPRSSSSVVPLLLPGLAPARFVEIDADAEFLAWQANDPAADGGAGPPTPERIQHLLEWVHGRNGTDFSYGGYLEDRRHILRGTYLDRTGGYVHLGVDFNVPQGSEVAAGIDARVLLVDDDHDRDGGWGCRVFLAPAPPIGPDVLLLFAHLQDVRAIPGESISASGVLAEVGGPPNNGNWHPHLHLQAVTASLFAKILTESFDALDGYGHPDELAVLAVSFPDPLALLERAIQPPRHG